MVRLPQLRGFVSVQTKLPPRVLLRLSVMHRLSVMQNVQNMLAGTLTHTTYNHLTIRKLPVSWLLVRKFTIQLC